MDTFHFRFSRLEEAENVLQKAEEIDARGTNNAPELENARKQMIAQVNEAIETKQPNLEILPATLKFSMNSIWKFVYGASFWTVISLSQLYGITKDQRKKEAFRGTLLMAVITGLLGMFIKGLWWPWFHIFIWPWVCLIMILIFLLPFVYIANKFVRERNSHAHGK